MDIWDQVPFTWQRFLHLAAVEKGDIWFDPKWQSTHKSGPRHNRPMKVDRRTIDFAERLGLVYLDQKQPNGNGWVRYALTTDGEVLLSHWKKGEGSGATV